MPSYIISSAKIAFIRAKGSYVVVCQIKRGCRHGFISLSVEARSPNETPWRLRWARRVRGDAIRGRKRLDELRMRSDIEPRRATDEGVNEGRTTSPFAPRHRFCGTARNGMNIRRATIIIVCSMSRRTFDHSDLARTRRQVLILSLHHL
jgi:hypothetical protein